MIRESGIFIPAENLLGDLPTRVVTARHHDDLPDDDYFFTEAYCSDPACDCRRVQFWVVGAKPKQILATITYAWESREFYERWQGSQDVMWGADLEPLGRQSEHAPALLKIFRESVLPSPGYAARIRRHYQLFKAAAASQVKPSSRPSRNQACPCGSGRKYKRCCLGQSA
ncbi:MAG: SEC-C domain-containing protein [Armatimonadetes bacterium]|nr:SEC-C domain-containing protein [Armatimonadota bacterium]